MEIRLEHIVPAPLVGTFSLHPVWGTDFALQASKSYLLTAVSGRGKSTLLNIVHGSRKDFTGKLFIAGLDSTQFNLSEWTALRRNKLSFVFQDLRLFPQLSARENLNLKCTLAINPDQFLSKIPYYAKELGLDSLLDKKCATLSYGQQQRVAIIRALLQDFEYLLLDEPFSHLDEENISRVCRLLETEIRERNAGMVISSLGYDYPYPFSERIAL